MQKLALIGFGLVIAVTGLVLLETGLRWFRVGDQALFGDPFLSFAAGRDLFERKVLPTGETVYVTVPEKTAYFNHQEFPAEKSANTYRIFSLGGSTTAGRPYDDKVSFSGFLRRYLAAMDPSRQWEVVNAGAISYASYRVALLMEELVRYSPDLFIVYTGHNEFLEERAYPPLLRSHPALKGTWIWLNGLRSYNLASRLWKRLLPAADEGELQMAGEVAAKPDDWTGVDGYRRDDELKEAIVAHFEYNLDHIVSIAEAHGVDLIFIAPASNVKDFSPFKSEHASSATADQIEQLEALLSEARAILEDGDGARAVPLLERAVEVDPTYAETHFLLGQARLAAAPAGPAGPAEPAEPASDTELARRALLRAKDLDVAPLRALESMTDLVRATAAEASIPLIDLPRILEADSDDRFGHRILGNDYLLDHVHPDIPVHSRIAEEVARLLAARGVARPREDWSEEKRQATYDAVLAGIDRRYYAERDLNLAKVLGWAGKTVEAEEQLRRAAAVLTDNPEVFLNLGIVLQKQQRWDEAARHLEKVISLEPESAAAHFNLGVVYAGLGRIDDGIASLRHALALQPDYPEALYNLGVVLGRSRNPSDGLAALEAALATHPDSPEIHLQIGLVQRRLGDWQASIEAFERVLELDSGNTTALAGLAGTYARQQLFDEAERFYRQAIETEANRPEAARMHFDLGVTLARQDKTTDAIGAYRDALALDPSLAEAGNNLGILLSTSGDLEGASRAFIQAITADAEYAEAYFNLGVIYDRAGQPREALRAITRAVELDDDNGRFHLGLGMLLAALGETDRARFHLDQAQRLGETLPPGNR